MRLYIISLLLIVLTIFTACKTEEPQDKNKIRDLEYTVIERENLPEIVLEKIEDEKTMPFKFSYSDGEYIYVAIGYGEQLTGGYSIQVRELYETDSYIVVKTELIGPTSEELATSVITYPFIVIRTEDIGLPFCFK